MQDGFAKKFTKSNNKIADILVPHQKQDDVVVLFSKQAGTSFLSLILPTEPLCILLSGSF